MEASRGGSVAAEAGSRRVEAAKAALRGGAAFLGGETGGGRADGGEGGRRPCFPAEKEEEDRGKGGFVIIEKSRGLTERQNFPLI